MSNSRFNRMLREKLGCENYNALNCGDECFLENFKISGENMNQLQKLLEYELLDVKNEVYGNIFHSRRKLTELKIEKNILDPNVPNKNKLLEKQKKILKKQKYANQKVRMRRNARLAPKAQGRKFVKR